LAADILERDKILQVARGGLIYPTTHWHPDGDLWEAKILKGVKNSCNAFLQGGFTEIWHDGGL